MNMKWFPILALAVVAACGSSSNRTSIELASGSPYGIAVDTTNVYWTNTGGGPAGTIINLVMKVPLGGGLAVTLASGEGALGIAVDATSVYWTDMGDFKLMKAPLAGGTPVTLASDLDFPNGIAVDSTSVYWTNSGNTGGSGTVMKIPLDGGTPVTLAAGQNTPSGIAVDSTNVYWTNLGTFWTNLGNGTGVGNGTVMKVSLDGGTAVTLASGQDGPSRIAVDSTSVYWIDSGDSAANGYAAVMKVPLGGGTPVMLASTPYSALGPRESYGIAVDATSVYWASDIQQGPVATGTVTKVTPK